MSSRNEENANAGSGGAGAEIRRDLRGEAVIVSPGRAGRPYDFNESAEARLSRCPFCPGHERETPPEVDAVRRDGSAPDGPGWTVRVVPNKYPAFPREPGGGSAAWGVHEAIVESPEHGQGLADMPAAQVADVLGIYQRRLRAARADGRIEYGCIFKNHGPEAGASLEHPHSQLMAVPFVPRRIAEEVQAHRRGAFAAKLAAVRPVAETGRLAAFCPRMPGYPTRHGWPRRGRREGSKTSRRRRWPRRRGCSRGYWGR
jgi:galactose-1-phosphate uridylyltransferase